MCNNVNIDDGIVMMRGNMKCKGGGRRGVGEGGYWVPRGRTSGVRCSSLQKASVSRGDVLWVEVPQDVLYEYEGVNHRVGETSQCRVREGMERVLMVLRKDRYEVRV